MAQLFIKSTITLKESITSIHVIDVTGDGKGELVVSTIMGDIRILRLKDDNNVEELARIEELPPSAVIDTGDVTCDGRIDVVVGGLDNTLRVISLSQHNLEILCECPLGSLPIAICATNVTGNQGAEVIVATDDCALRCFGWYGTLLDKLAHKVIERPVFSIRPFHSKSMPYSRIIFGDDSEYLFLYQYADDRLHEISRIKARGPVDLVATGNLTDGRVDEVVVISKKTITVFGQGHSGLEIYDNIRAPNTVSAVKIGTIMKTAASPGQIVVSQADSLLSILSLDGRRIVEECSIKTKKKAADTQIDLGDVDGDGVTEIVQTVDNSIFLFSIS